jgi:hypothetical protein
VPEKTDSVLDIPDEDRLAVEFAGDVPCIYYNPETVNPVDRIKYDTKVQPSTDFEGDPI